MANIASECSTVNVALAQLQVVFAGADFPSYKTEQGGEDILRSFDAVATGCSMILSLLEQYLADAVKRDGVESLSLSNGVSRKEKAKFVWNEDEIKDLLLQLRGYQTSLTLLLNVLHIRSGLETQRMLIKHRALLIDVRNLLQASVKKRHSAISEITIQSFLGNEFISAQIAEDHPPMPSLPSTTEKRLSCTLDPNLESKTVGIPIKCVVVGDGACDKSQFLISYTTCAYPGEYIPTVFDNYKANIRFDGKLYELSLWDTAGQEDYDRLRPLSYPQTDVFLVVFSIINRASFESIRLKWNPELDKFVGPHVPRILVGLKKASRDDPEIVENLRKHRSVPVRSDEGLQLAKEMQAYQYVECDVLTRHNLDRAFEEVIRAVVNPTTPRRSRKKIRFALLS